MSVTKRKLCVSGRFAEFSELLQAGFTGVEVGFSSRLSVPEMLSDAKLFVDGARKAELEINSIHLPFGRHLDFTTRDTAYRNKIIALHKEMLDGIPEYVGTKIAVIHPSFEPIGDDERMERLEICHKVMAELGEYAARYDIRLAAEDLPRTCLGHSADELLYLTDNGKNAAICFDVNHLLIDTHEEFIKKVGKHIITTHLSDYDRVDEKHWFIGDGIIDWKNLVAMLDDIGYNGAMLFEHSSMPPRRTEKISAQQLYDKFYELIK